MMVSRALLLLMLGLLPGCGRGGMASCEQDRRQAQAVLEKDKRVARISHEADQLALQGRPRQAADRIEADAKIPMDEAISAAKAWKPQTVWGAERAKDLLALTEQRRQRLTAYVTALRSEQLTKVVEQMELQRDLEKQALEVEKTLSAGPQTADACAILPDSTGQ
ncbi:MAG TPA: hypothetical protein PLJ27_14500 [Polyangiaceae bacterium]|jgi:hypothetical protein|nr:MAG: hypothetical protein BWY17_02817 [Deltaproteobacteria bacterium ADurb.Bin207]HNS95790.1 hypothetical protein [Polyangiaceae bacterium]HNZ24619.1 hypothetical protein [Polyangiaceae bacterium]HOD23249.1 hypothetical protein [Polyangiaceae bacterium]HOE51005.1 hypothetical protein [Polyangiaceae bacterium]